MDIKTKIGFLDSGVGGLSVLSYAMDRLPFADYIYYADCDHVPYGTKTSEEIIEYTDEAVRLLIERGAEVVVIACNTATSMAAGYVREKYSLPIIGMEPAVKPALAAHHGERILVCATPATIAGKRLHDLIERNYTDDVVIDLAALPELVTYAEREIFDTDIICSYLDRVIKKSRGYSAVVLGCTHFGYFRDSFRSFFGNIDIIDGTAGTVRRLIAVLDEHGLLENCNGGSFDKKISVPEFYISGRLIDDCGKLDFFNRLIERSRTVG